MSTIVKGGFLDARREARREELRDAAHQRLFERADDVLADKLQDPVFQVRHATVAGLFPRDYTPMREVLKDPDVAEGLRELVQECMADERLRLDVNVSDAFQGRGSTGKDEQAAERPETEYTAAYRHLHRQLYDLAEQEQEWEPQRIQCDAVRFLLALCRMTSGNNRQRGFSGRYLFKRELSKQAKKERYLEQRNSSGMWDTGMWY